MLDYEVEKYLLVDLKLGSGAVLQNYTALGINFNHVFAKEHNNNVLMIAIDYNNVNVVKKLVDFSVDINHRNDYGYTALMLAVKRNNTVAVDLLLAMANQDNRITYGEQALWLALLHNHVDIATKILSVWSEKFMGDIELIKKHILEFAIKTGERNSFDLLLSHSNINHVDCNGNTMLMLAIKNRQHDLVELLLRKDAGLDFTSWEGHSPLSLSILYDSPTVSKIIAKTKNFLLDNVVAQHCFRPLMFAASKGLVSVVAALISRNVMVDQINGNNETALSLAAKKDHVEVVKLLLENNAQMYFYQNPDTHVLNVAVKYRSAKVANFLLFFFNNKIVGEKEIFLNAIENNMIFVVDKFIKSGSIMTACGQQAKNEGLIVAAKGGNMFVLRRLLYSKANVNYVNQDGDNVLNILAKKRNKDLLYEFFVYAELYENNCYGKLDDYVDLNDYFSVTEQKNKLNLAIRDKQGGTGLRYAITHRDHKLLEYLVQAKASVNNYDNEQYCSPLMLASLYGDVRAVKYLLQHHADVNQTNAHGFSALLATTSCFSCKSCEQVIALLLDKKASPNAETVPNKYVPLYFAVMHNSLNVVEMLLANNANVNHMSLDSYSALLLASQQQHVDIVVKLIEYNAKINFPAGGCYRPLMMAVVKQNKQLFDLLLHKGASFNFCVNGRYKELLLKDKVDKKNFIILERDVVIKHDFFDKLHQSINIKFNPLLLALWDNNKYFIQELLSRGAKVDFNSGIEYQNLIITVLTNNHNDIGKQITEKYSIINKMSTNVPFTPLMLAVLRGFNYMAGCLMKNCADPAIVNVNNHSALIFAIMSGNIKIARKIIAALKKNNTYMVLVNKLLAGKLSAQLGYIDLLHEILQEVQLESSIEPGKYLIEVVEELLDKHNYKESINILSKYTNVFSRCKKSILINFLAYVIKRLYYHEYSNVLPTFSQNIWVKVLKKLVDEYNYAESVGMLNLIKDLHFVETKLRYKISVKLHKDLIDYFMMLVGNNFILSLGFLTKAIAQQSSRINIAVIRDITIKNLTKGMLPYYLNLKVCNIKEFNKELDLIFRYIKNTFIYNITVLSAKEVLLELNGKNFILDVKDKQELNEVKKILRFNYLKSKRVEQMIKLHNLPSKVVLNIFSWYRYYQEEDVLHTSACKTLKKAQIKMLKV